MPLMSHIKRKLLLVYANNKGADQAAHARSLISAIVIHCLDSTIIHVATPALSEFSNLASPCSLARWSESYHAAQFCDIFSHGVAKIWRLFIGGRAEAKWKDAIVRRLR